MLPDLDAILASAPFVPQAWRVPERTMRGELMVEAVRVWPSPAFAVYPCFRGQWLPWADFPVPLAAEDPGYEGDYRPELLDGWSTPLPDLFARIPAEVMEAVRPLPESCQWTLLCLLDAEPEAMDLVRDNPVLAALVSQLSQWSTIHPVVPIEEVAAAVREPRHKGPLRLLGLPERRWVVRVLGKTPPEVLEEVGSERLKDLITASDKRVLRWLNHLPAITLDVVHVLGTPDRLPLVSFALLAEAPEPDEPCIVDALEFIVSMRELGLAPPRPARFRSRAELFAAFAEAAATDQAFPEGLETPTGELVLPGEPRVHLRPIASLRAMAEHGLTQENCLLSSLSYASVANLGGGALWAATWKVGTEKITGTAWARLDDEGRWFLQELEGPRGMPPHPALWDRLDAWVDSLNPSEDPPTGASRPAEIQLALPLTRAPSPAEAPTWFQAVSRLRSVDRAAAMERRAWR